MCIVLREGECALSIRLYDKRLKRKHVLVLISHNTHAMTQPHEYHMLIYLSHGNLNPALSVFLPKATSLVMSFITFAHCST